MSWYKGGVMKERLGYAMAVIAATLAGAIGFEVDVENFVQHQVASAFIIGGILTCYVVVPLWKRCNKRDSGHIEELSNIEKRLEAIYAGMPRASHDVKVDRRIFSELDIIESTTQLIRGQLKAGTEKNENEGEV